MPTVVPDEVSPCPAGEGTGTVSDNLDGDVVGSRPAVLGDPGSDLVRFAPGEQFVNQPVTAATGQILDGESPT
ncbi:hypothetical protein [Streptomyces sp. NPDC019224]|uniref:hypothetical protein n=1 Tax=Streptomyces sp. NPDC019224 TaxID=3154484 RepID=UPI0033FB2DA4